MKSNKRCNLFDEILAFLTMRQWEKEGDSLYLKRFKINLEPLYTARGRHVLCSKDMIELVDKDYPTDDEVE